MRFQRRSVFMGVWFLLCFAGCSNYGSPQVGGPLANTSIRAPLGLPADQLIGTWQSTGSGDNPLGMSQLVFSQAKTATPAVTTGQALFVESAKLAPEGMPTQKDAQVNLTEGSSGSTASSLSCSWDNYTTCCQQNPQDHWCVESKPYFNLGPSGAPASSGSGSGNVPSASTSAPTPTSPPPGTPFYLTATLGNGQTLTNLRAVEVVSTPLVEISLQDDGTGASTFQQRADFYLIRKTKDNVLYLDLCPCQGQGGKSCSQSDTGRCYQKFVPISTSDSPGVFQKSN